MAQITPSELSEREFTRSIRGYNAAEVDEYINRIVENYAKLYRENIELRRQLAEAETRSADYASEEALVRQTLETAKKASDTVIEEAYGRADEILSSVKASCDAILKNFRDKIEAQKAALLEIEKTVNTFKNELFEKYRLHIELIEQISPAYEYEEELSPEQYVSHVVSDLKKEVAAQYGISLESLSKPDTAAESKAYEPTVELTTAKDDLLSVSEAARSMASAERPKRKKDAIPSALDLLDDAETEEINIFDKTTQFKSVSDPNAITAERPAFK